MFCLLELLGNTWIPKHIYNNLKHIYIYIYISDVQAKNKKIKIINPLVQNLYKKN